MDFDPLPDAVKAMPVMTLDTPPAGYKVARVTGIVLTLTVYTISHGLDTLRAQAHKQGANAVLGLRFGERANMMYGTAVVLEQA
jgi:uncharacterized protein YbjQ (UPF0145 family)